MSKVEYDLHEYARELEKQIVTLTARVAELESENASLKRTFETWNEWFKQNFKEKP